VPNVRLEFARVARPTRKSHALLVAAQPERLYSLGILRTIGPAILLLVGTSCATQPEIPAHQMQTCVEGAIPAGIELAAFSEALQKAQSYSDKVYGEDCFVCAEVFDDADTYMLHITSPIEDMLINTSAAITVRKSDGAVTDRSIWHSCHARLSPAADTAPNKAVEPTR
jgi:hypothetical protein